MCSLDCLQGTPRRIASDGGGLGPDGGSFGGGAKVGAPAAKQHGLVVIGPVSRPAQGRGKLLTVRVAIGLVAAAAGGAGLPCAPPEPLRLPWQGAAAAVLLTGLYLVLSGVVARRALARRSAPVPAAERASDDADEPDVLLPMLGALLVYKFRRLSEAKLYKALEAQQNQGKGRRMLGDILLDMGFVTPAQLRQALDYQQEYLRRKRVVSQL